MTTPVRPLPASPVSRCTFRSATTTRLVLDTEPEPDVPKLLDRYAWLSDRVLADGWHTATVLPQLHVLIYGNRRAV